MEDNAPMPDGGVDESVIDEKKDGVIEKIIPNNAEPNHPHQAASREELKRVFKRAAWYSLALALVVTVISEGDVECICQLNAHRRTSPSTHVFLALRL